MAGKQIEERFFTCHFTLLSCVGTQGEGMSLQRPSVDSSASTFTPLVVVELATDTKEEAIGWLLGRIRDKQQNGGRVLFLSPNILCFSSSVFNPAIFPGAELLVEQLGPGVGAQEKENPNMFLVGASWQRLLSGAEEVGLFKEFSDGSMRAFTSTNKHNFKDFKGEVKGSSAWRPLFGLWIFLL